jgi:hypothetical protein
MARPIAIILSPTAKRQLVIIILLALRQMEIAEGSLRRLFERITTSAATTAIADPPAPIATPTRAEAKAVASEKKREERQKGQR